MYICKKAKKADEESEMKFKLAIEDLIEQEKIEAEYYNYNFKNNEFDEKEEGSGGEEIDEEDSLIDTKKYYEKNAIDYLENDKNFYSNKIPLEEIYNSGQHYETFSTNNKENFNTENSVFKNNNDSYDSTNKHLDYTTHNEAYEKHYSEDLNEPEPDDDGLGDDNEVYISNN